MSFNLRFNLSLVKAAKKQPKEIKTSKSTVSRLCLGTVVFIDNEYKISIPNNDKELIIPFTEKSLDLKHKTEVYYKIPDKNGRYTKYIRDPFYAAASPSVSKTFSVVVPGKKRTGYIVKQNGKLLFELDQVHRSKITSDELCIDESKPLFNEPSNSKSKS